MPDSAPPRAPPPPAWTPPPPPPPSSPAPGWSTTAGPRDLWSAPNGPGAPQRDLYSPSAAAMPMTPAPAASFIPVELSPIAADPIIRAASSLLLLLGRLRASLSQANAAQLMDQVYQAIEKFEVDARAASVPADQAEAGKYALAATADDIVQNLPNVDPRIWTQYSMLARIFRERQGGVRFFEELKKAQMNPALNVGLLELMHACLSLGFEGKFRATHDIGALQAIKRDVYEAIRRNRPKTIEDLSPHWRGKPVALAGSRFEVPVWVAACAALAVLLIVFVVFRALLGWRNDALIARVDTLFPKEPVTIWREKPPPPPPPVVIASTTQFERINRALADELGRTLTTEQNPRRIVIRIASINLFGKGDARIVPAFAPTAQKIAAALDKEPGTIFIDGYTDPDPIKTREFPSNYELSDARAHAVAAILKPGIAKQERLKATGFADRGCEDRKMKEDAKAKCRRVEVSIERSE
jgi:type VI secretion system protein ImpK